MLQRDLEERDEVLLERDHRIYELKRANQVLPENKKLPQFNLTLFLRYSCCLSLKP